MSETKTSDQFTAIHSGQTNLIPEPLESRVLFSTTVDTTGGAAPVAGDGTTGVPAAQIIMQLRKVLEAKAVQAAQALAKVLQLPPFTGFWHS